jgi:radical SAM protein with 4Fe4S-binding SPASM domain
MSLKPQCIIPWVYLEIFPEGTVTPCCANILTLGDIKTTPLEEIWNGEKMNQFRRSLFAKKLPSSCQACMETEKLGVQSLREKYNDFFNSSFPSVVDNTNEDGSLKTITFKGWDFKVSNKCNFKCRSCGPTLSSSFTGVIQEHAKDLNINQFVDNNIDYFELIEFAGGETLLMDEQYELLEKLINRGRTDVELWYNTNMSVLSYKGKNVLDYWNKWNPDKLTIFASIDEIGDRAEYIRKGTRWEIVDKNLRTIASQKFKRHINTVVSCLNVFRLPEIIEHLTDIGYIDQRFGYSNFDLSLFGDIGTGVSGECVPLNIEVLPPKFKLQTKQKLISFINDYNLKHTVDISGKFIHILKLLSGELNMKSLGRFLTQNIDMDKNRNESLVKVIPEFKEVIKEYKTIRQ